MEYENAQELARAIQSMWARLHQDYEGVELHIEVSEDDIRYVESITDDGEGNIVLVLGRPGGANGWLDQGLEAFEKKAKAHQ